VRGAVLNGDFPAPHTIIAARASTAARAALTSSSVVAPRTRREKLLTKKLWRDYLAEPFVDESFRLRGSAGASPS